MPSSEDTEDSSRNTLTKIKKTNMGLISAKIVHNQLDQTHCRKPLATVFPNCRYHCHTQDTVKL